MFKEMIRANYKKWFFGHYHDNRNINAEEILLYEQIIRIGEGDLFIGISFPRYSAHTVQAMQFAKNAGSKDVIKELPERQRLILDDVIKDTTITVAQLAKNRNVTERTIMRDIDVLQKSGILHREGGRKDGRWVISTINP